LKSRVERIQTWDEFKNLLIKLQPEEIFYAQGLAPLANPPVELRLIFTAEKVQYIFIDTATEGFLRRTKLPVSNDKHGNPNLEEEDVANFIRSELERENIKIRSFELMGGY
jgi:hypothetical protein